ncbi:MAG: hypothetical protein RLZZ618_204 [Pseudomonadota bacterium]|jgi:hypothetical protein
MPIAALLHFAVAIFFAVHAVRNGKDRYWLMVLFAFPLLGSAVYFFAEYSRELQHTRGGRRALRLMQGVINPDRELRYAREEFDRTPTAFNEAQLARALLAKGDVDQAIVHYKQCVSGPYAQDLSFLKGLAIAQLEAQQFAPAVTTLDALVAAHPDQHKGDVSLMRAEALAGAGRPEADDAFEHVIRTDGSIEAQCKYAQFLLGKGRTEAARKHFEQVLTDARRGHGHSRDLNREWIGLARDALKNLGS